MEHCRQADSLAFSNSDSPSKPCDQHLAAWLRAFDTSKACSNCFKLHLTLGTATSKIMDSGCRSQQEEDDSQGDAHPRKRIKLKARRGAVTPSGADKKEMEWSQTEDTSVQTLYGLLYPQYTLIPIIPD